MPLVVERDDVQQTYEDAARRGWVIPAFGVENLTTIEAVLDATSEHAARLGYPDLPVTLAITNLYPHRQQTAHYTHTRRWDMGLRLFLADVKVLTERSGPFDRLRVMMHLDHIQHDMDCDLLQWDMRQFSSLMFDASTLPFPQNIAATRRFVAEHHAEIVIEGACDEIIDVGGSEISELTNPERACTFATETGVDFVVANLGTEHRASAIDLHYHGELAREISRHIGPRLVLHGCSSVPADQVARLFDDGIRKVNIWTALERDSAPALLVDMVRNAAKVAGAAVAQSLTQEGYLGTSVDIRSAAHLDYFTTSYRQQKVFEKMKEIVTGYLTMWYR